jgi:signal transduction histidine kinase
MSLINDILDVASIEAGYMTLDIEKVDLEKTIKSVVELVSQRINGQSITLNVSYIRRNLIGMCDMKRIKQVIFKMLNNAIGRSSEKGEVSLFVRCVNNKYLVLSIKDYGDYLSVEDQNQIFNKFYGMGNAITAKNKDNLGMSLVKSIVELHGGRVGFVSKKNEYNVLRAIIPLHNKELICDNKIDNNSVEQMVI